MKNRDIEAGAKAIADDLKLPGGRRKKFARLVADHLEWFDLAEARGMTWDDIIAVLAAAGVKRDNGLPLSRGALSSTVWRKRQETLVASRQGVGPTPEVARESKPGKPSQQLRRAPKERATARPGKGGRHAAKGTVRENSPADDRPAVSGARAQDKNASNSVLAYMHRAARIRRNADETDR